MTTPSDEPANRSRVFVALGILGVVIAAILGLVLLAGKLIFDGVGGSDESLTASRMQQEREASELWRRPEEWLEEARDQVGILRMRRTRRAKNALPHQDPWVDEFKTLGPLPPDMIALGETSFRKSREAKLVWLENFRSSSDLETLEDLLREAELQAECELPLAALEALARGAYFTVEFTGTEPPAKPEPGIEVLTYSCFLNSEPVEVCVVVEHSKARNLQIARERERLMRSGVKLGK